MPSASTSGTVTGPVVTPPQSQATPISCFIPGWVAAKAVRARVGIVVR